MDQRAGHEIRSPDGIARLSGGGGKYGVAPSLVAECLTPEGEAVIGAMTRCDRCGSIEECRHFFDQPGRDADGAREFCPNADPFTELAEKLRRKATGEGQG